MDQWWYVRGGERNGPISLHQVVQLAREHKLDRETILWNPALPDWKSVNDFPDLAKLLDAPLPVPAEVLGAIKQTVASLEAPNVAVVSAAHASQPDVGGDFKASPLNGAITLVYSPWRRYWAKTFDLMVSVAIVVVAEIGLAFLSPPFALWIQNPDNAVFLIVSAFGCAPFIEAAMASIFGNSPGKALLGLVVRNRDGARLDFSSQVVRNWRVVLFGLGLYIPIITLFALVHQYRVLKKDGATAYDAHSYAIEAAPIGWHRYAIAFAIIASFYGLSQLAETQQRNADRAYALGQEWINPHSLMKVQIPSGWLADSQKNSTGQTVYVFTRPAEELQVVFGREVIPNEAGLAIYLKAFIKAVSAEMDFSPPASPQSIGLNEVWTIRGGMVKDKTQRISATFIDRGKAVWRTVAVRYRGADPETQSYIKLRELLLLSTNDE